MSVICENIADKDELPTNHVIVITLQYITAFETLNSQGKT